MNNKQIGLVIGSLLHDYGKILSENNGIKNYSLSGYEHIKNLGVFEEKSPVLDCIRYHRRSELENADVENNSICYITYIADNIASSTDCRSEKDGETENVRNISLESVFNVLNGNLQNYVYESSQLKEIPNFPKRENVCFDDSFYAKIVDDTDSAIKEIEFSECFVNSLLSSLEMNLSFIPSSAQTGGLRDISLYDHLKLTAAFSSCIEQYLSERNITDYRTELFIGENGFYDKKAFLVYSVDFSGIQQFIYNISSKSALKGLRARSFYLEILMETFVDELLERLNLSRANVLYTGGGHTYLLLANTESTKENISKIIEELNEWFIDTFDNSLYAAEGYSECSANDLKNIPDGSYKNVFATISKMISNRKTRRYSANQLRKLNTPDFSDHSRECVICHRMGSLNGENQCELCSALIKLSDMILDRGSHFVIVNENCNEERIKMPFGYFLTAQSPEKIKNYIENGCYVRSYSKNKDCTGKSFSKNLWIGNYSGAGNFDALVNNSRGIKRLGIIRADVDNLGQSFVSGFSETGGGKYETITRTSVFSRRLSEFFKYHINYVLEHGEFHLFDGDTHEKRNAAIIYSGGDDLFIVGGWDDIIGFAVDLYNALRKYTQDTLTVSAGIGLYHKSYPIYSFAGETEELEEFSKNYKDENQEKNAVTLFDENNTYSWTDFIEKVIGEKLNALKEFINNNDTHGKAMLYNMLDIIKDKREDRLNIARFAYLLARLEPKKKDGVISEKYKTFERRMYQWINDEKDCRQLVTAIYIYIYMNRGEEAENGNGNVK